MDMAHSTCTRPACGRNTIYADEITTVEDTVEDHARSNPLN